MHVRISGNEHTVLAQPEATRIQPVNVDKYPTQFLRGLPNYITFKDSLVTFPEWKRILGIQGTYLGNSWRKINFFLG